MFESLNVKKSIWQKFYFKGLFHTNKKWVNKFLKFTTINMIYLHFLKILFNLTIIEKKLSI